MITPISVTFQNESNEIVFSISNVAPSADAQAIHDNVDGEIADITVKETPIGADIIISENSEDSNSKAKLTLATLPVSTPVATALGDKADDADVVHTTGDESMSGVKTFTGSLKVGAGRLVVPKRITTGPYTLLVTDYILFVNTDAGDVIVNFPEGAGGNQYAIYNTGTSGNKITLVPDGAETIIEDTLYDAEDLTFTFDANENWR
jgi:hypothetical protein